jgi:hypothetical protein
MHSMTDDRSMTISEIVDALTHTPAAFRALVAAAPAAALQFHERPEAWTPHEVLCHVADAEVTDWRPRVAIIVEGGANRRFAPFDREGGQRAYGAWQTPAVLAEFERLRAGNLAYLEGLGLDEAALQKTGVHPEFGDVTLGQLLACWVAHDLAHVNQIARVLLRRVGPDIGPWTKYFSLLQ